MAGLAFARATTPTIMARSFSIPMRTTSKLSVTSLSDGRRVLLDLMLWVVAIMDDGEP
jgi:phosphoenolpyruvate-protein kinase (PTS system EI component)